MKKSLVLSWVIVCTITSPVMADFILTGNQHMDVTSNPGSGSLYDSSIMNILNHGYVMTAKLYDESTINVSGTWGVNLFAAFAYENSSVNISSGQAMAIQTFQSAAVTVADGIVEDVFLADSSTMNVSGGNVLKVRSNQRSTTAVSGGHVGQLSVNDIQKGTERVNITAGSVDTLQIGTLNLQGNEHLDYNGRPSDAMSAWGIRAAEGTVNLLAFDTLTTNENSSILFSNGRANEFYVSDSSHADISGGTINGLVTSGSSSTSLTNGYIDILAAVESSTLDVYGGMVNALIAYDNSIINLHGGAIALLAADDDPYSLPSYDGIITFFGSDFILGDGLWLEGNRLRGTGILNGRWNDGTAWTTEITINSDTAQILLVPEPATLLLLPLGAIVLRRKK